MNGQSKCTFILFCVCTSEIKCFDEYMYMYMYEDEWHLHKKFFISITLKCFFNMNLRKLSYIKLSYNICWKKWICKMSSKKVIKYRSWLIFLKYPHKSVMFHLCLLHVKCNLKESNTCLFFLNINIFVVLFEW